jgi:hypothetical protein
LNRQLRSSSLVFTSANWVLAATGAVSIAMGLKMKLGYDIFRQLDDGSPIWIANVQSRTEAEQKVTLLRRSHPASYFLRNAETGAVITDFDPGSQRKVTPDPN